MFYVTNSNHTVMWLQIAEKRLKVMHEDIDLCNGFTSRGAYIVDNDFLA